MPRRWTCSPRSIRTGGSASARSRFRCWPRSRPSASPAWPATAGSWTGCARPRVSWRTEAYPAEDPTGLPLTLLRDEHGTPVRVTVALADGAALGAQIWIAQIGRGPLLLLDSYRQ